MRYLPTAFVRRKNRTIKKLKIRIKNGERTQENFNNFKPPFAHVVVLDSGCDRYRA